MNDPTTMTVKQTEPRTVAFIRMKGAFGQIPGAFGTLFHWVDERGLIPSGPPEAVYYNIPSDGPESEALWALRAPIVTGEPTPADDLGLGIERLDAQEVASAMHVGPFEDVATTYAALMAWIPAHGYAIAGPPEEVYLSDPAETPAEELQTEVHFPVRKA